MLDNIRVAVYPPQGKERKAMKLPWNALIWCVLIVCLTLLVFIDDRVIRKREKEINYDCPDMARLRSTKAC